MIHNTRTVDELNHHRHSQYAAKFINSVAYSCGPSSYYRRHVYVQPLALVARSLSLDNRRQKMGTEKGNQTHASQKRVPVVLHRLFIANSFKFGRSVFVNVVTKSS